MSVHGKAEKFNTSTRRELNTLAAHAAKTPDNTHCAPKTEPKKSRIPFPQCLSPRRRGARRTPPTQPGGTPPSRSTRTPPSRCGRTPPVVFPTTPRAGSILNNPTAHDTLKRFDRRVDTELHQNSSCARPAMCSSNGPRSPVPVYTLGAMSPVPTSSGTTRTGGDRALASEISSADSSECPLTSDEPLVNMVKSDDSAARRSFSSDRSTRDVLPIKLEDSVRVTHDYKPSPKDIVCSSGLQAPLVVFMC